MTIIRSYLKIRILVQVQGGPDVQPTVILQYFEELDEGPTPKLGQKTFLRYL